jgi:hypothetical protein
VFCVFPELNKSTLEKRVVSQTALFCEKTTLEKRVDYKTALFPRLKGGFDWRDEKACVRALYAKIVPYAGVQWILAGLLKKSTLKKGSFLKPPFSMRKPPLKKGSITKRPFFTHDWL